MMNAQDNTLPTSTCRWLREGMRLLHDIEDDLQYDYENNL